MAKSRYTKKAMRELFAPLWHTILRTPAESAQVEFDDGVVKVGRCYHRGRTGPAWTGSWSLYRNGICVCGADTMSAFIDSVHRYHIGQEATTKHTAGPWKIQPGEINIGPHSKGLMVGPLQYAKAHVIGPFEQPLDDETRANARLIAAAPDLLAALRHAAMNMPHPDQMIDDAIAKATGASAQDYRGNTIVTQETIYPNATAPRPEEI